MWKFRLKNRQFACLPVMSSSGGTCVPLYFSRRYDAKTAMKWWENLKKWNNPYIFHNPPSTSFLWEEFAKSIFYIHKFNKFIHSKFILSRFSNYILLDYETSFDCNVNRQEAESCIKLHTTPGNSDSFMGLYKPPIILQLQDEGIVYVGINSRFDIRVSNKISRIISSGFFTDDSDLEIENKTRWAKSYLESDYSYTYATEDTLSERYLVKQKTDIVVKMRDLGSYCLNHGYVFRDIKELRRLYNQFFNPQLIGKYLEEYKDAKLASLLQEESNG